MPDDLGALDVARQAELLELAHDAILVRDLRSSAVTYWNRGAERLYGFTREEARGQVTHRLLQTVFPESQAALDAVLVSNGYWEGELRHTRKDGTQVIVSSRQAVQRDPDGQPLAILEINTDITARKDAENERVKLAAEHRARQLAEQALARVSILQQVTASLSEARTPAEVGAVIMDQGIAALQARSGRIALLRPDGESVDIVAAVGYERVRTPLRLSEPLPTNQVIRTGEAIFVAQFEAVLERFPDLADAVSPLIPGALASVPLVVDGRVIGAISLVFEGERALDMDERDLLIALATQCALALERARLYELALSTQTELRQSRDQLAAMLEGIAEGVTVQDVEGRLIYANTVAARLSGFESAEAFRQAFPNVLRRYELLDEDGQPFAYDRLPGRRLLRGEQPGEIVVEFRDIESGEWRWSILDATPVYGPDGRLQLVVNIFRDITDRKREADKAALLSQASAVLASALDVSSTLQDLAELLVPRLADWCIIDVFGEADGRPRRVAVACATTEDRALADAVRARPPDTASTGHGLEDLIQPRAALVARLRVRGETLGSMTLLTRSSGRQLSARDRELAEELAARTGLAIDSARLFREAQERADHQATLNRALRETVEERDRAVEDLRQALRTRDEFLASASHDLKNPLASIKATAQLLERRLERGGAVDIDRMRDGLHRLDTIATRAAGLVEQLLDLARLQMGRPLDLDLQRADLVPPVREVVLEHQQLSDRHTIDLQVSDREVIGDWDVLRLGRVVSNLLDNAIKYSPAGGSIRVVMRREDDTLCIDVVDQGIGIPSSDHGRIFERFQRATNVEGRISGTGIGLASARHIVESHGGTITVESQEGVGSTFRVRLALGLATDGSPARNPEQRMED